MKISYIDFWSGFEPNNFWFSRYLKHRYQKNFDFTSSPEEADIIIGSGFANNILKYNDVKAIKIFYTGENERPKLNLYDYSISFDYDDYGGRNIRFPLWYLYVNWWNDGIETAIEFDEFNRVFDPIEVYKRENFCCIMIGNPVQNRIQLALKLNEYKPVHSYGKVFNNPYTGRKIGLLQKYRYNICFENSLYDGYHTEKLLEAKIAGCIPIYYGADTVSLDFNKDCYINYKDFDSSEEFVEYIKEIDDNEEKFVKIASEPLFKENPKFTQLDNFFDRFII